MSFLHLHPTAVISFVVAFLVMAVQLSSANNGEACTVDEDCILENDYCEDTNGDFTKDTCQCQYGFYFSEGKCWSEDESQPQDPCDQKPCMHGGDCASRDQELICHCMPGYTGVTCEAELFCKPGTYFNSLHNKCYECELGTYSENVSGREAVCQPCPSDDQGVNSTTRETGAANVTECVFNPIVYSISPTYGPVSGGTPIIITFTHLDTHQVASVQMGEQTCQVIQSNATSITCVTSQAPQSDSLGPLTGPLRLTFQDSYVTETLFNFTYMPDPAITSIDNYYTFISGGLTMTIRGQNFDSILSPELKITRFHDGETRLFTSGCSLSNSSVMGCIVPNLAVDMTHRLFSIPTNRQRRAVGVPTFNDRTTQFYAGFNLDGVKTFQNMSVAPGRYPSQLPVYPDPIYYPFEADDMVQDFSPGHHTYLHLEGKYLNAACRVQDVTVTIGRNVCDVTFLATNQLTCLPPDTQPEPDDTGHGPGKTPRVTVYVGNLIYVVGYLSYSTTGSKSDAAIGAIVAVAVIIPALLIIAIVLVCYRRRQALSRNSKPSRMNSVSMAQSNIYFEPDANGYSTISHSPNGQAIDNSDSIPSNLPQLPLVHNAQRMARNMSSSVSPPSTPGLISLDSGDTFGTAYFSNGKTYDIMDEISEDLRLTVQECQLDSGRLTLDDMVGQGYFGKVFKGDLTDERYHNPKTVAVKTVQGAHSSLKDVTAFLEEAVVMKDFNHPNVLALLGVTIVNNTPYVVLPFMEHGDLKSYIKEPTRRIKVRDLLAFGVLIADGMCYLANQKFVHRDLATRNCMVDKSLNIKIADFGLSRDIYKSDYYRVEDKHRPLPVKWMAVESLTTGLFSTKSDVWAYGVVLWELLTRGCTPYPDVSTFNIKGYLLSGRRLSQPEHAPSDVYELMCRCWMERPEERPSFEELYNELKEIINDRHTANHPDYLKLIDA